MLVHFVIDDKFIDMALRDFETAAPGVNQAVILGKRRALQFVKTKEITFMSLAQAKELVHSDKCDAVVFHSLYDGFLPILKSVPADKKTVWLGWGYDYYDRLLKAVFPEGLLLPMTKQLVADAPGRPLKEKMVNWAKATAKRLLGRSTDYKPEMLDRIDYFSPVLDVEHQMARHLNPWFKADYVTWNYGTVEDDLSDGEILTPDARDILVGNSATAENNHLEVFDVIAKHLDLQGRKIIVPLSYGDSWYRDRIIEAGNRMFGDRFVPLTGYLPRNEYISLLSGCSIVFMNHLRQQAVANVCIMMLKGAKIFMQERSPLYTWLRHRGAYVETISTLQQMDANSRKTISLLTDEQRLNNIKLVNSFWGREAQLAKTRHLVALALSRGKQITANN